jgi:hypothetical protein
MNGCLISNKVRSRADQSTDEVTVDDKIIQTNRKSE